MENVAILNVAMLIDCELISDTKYQYFVLIILFSLMILNYKDP